jgi:Na+/proline symporter
MRWKLIIIAALVTTIIGAGLPFIIYNLLVSTDNFKSYFPLMFLFIIPIFTIVFSSIFVYRHTARRRSLQAMATALLSCILLLLTFLLTSTLSFRQYPKQPVPSPDNIG